MSNDNLRLNHIRTEVLSHTGSIAKTLGTPSPWAVLLVKFSDDPESNPDTAIYERLFTDSGSGSNNMPEFFADMSHGRLNLARSKVFGWYTLAVKRSKYVGNLSPVPAGKIDRGGLAAAARAVATANGVNLADFSGVVVSAYGATDLCGWVGGMTALCDQNSLQPSLLGQEMGHGYGLDHARLNGSPADYQDPWDVMSTAAWPAYEQPDPDYTRIGPGLNAWCMRSRGWLDEARVWSGSAGVDAVITLRPLHRPEFAGYLAAQLGQYLVELRVPEQWDSSIGDACVLVHRFEDNHSYLMPAKDGSQSLTTGDVFESGSPEFTYSDYQRVEVISIDAHNHSAQIRLVMRSARQVPQTVGTIFGAVDVDSGGYLILPSGKVVKIPPRGPVTEMVTLVARLAESEITGDVALALASRKAILSSIIDSAARLSDETELISSPPPQAREQR